MMHFRVALFFLITVVTGSSMCVSAADDLVLSTSVISDYNGEQISCAGECDGIAIVSVSGGIPPYSYSWSDGQSTQVAIGLCAGMYIVTVTDQTPCSKSDTVFLSDPAPLELDTDPFEFIGGFNISCPGASDGQVTATASGGVGGYSYLWSDGQSGSTASGLPAGLIFVLATDNNGCTVIDSVELQEPDPISAANSTILNISCAGRTDGFVDLNMSGGSGSYSYSWADGPVSPIRNNLTAGFYTVSVTDIQGCSFDTTIEIAFSPALLLKLENIKYETCPESADGAIDISVSGGSPPYQYIWNHGVTVEDPGDLSDNTYYVTASDDRGCTITHPIVVGTKSKINVSSLKVNPSCSLNDGLIHLNVAGSAGSVDYLWDNGQTSSSASNLEAGVHSVTIMDSVCVLAKTYSLDNSGSFSAEITFVNADCNTSTGSATANPVGGIAPYTWSWSDGQTTQTAATLSAGFYEVEITDSKGCITRASVDLKENNSLGLETDIVKPSFCGANNASITLSTTAGTPPFTILWSNTQTGPTATGLRSGVYLAVVEDLAGCRDTARVFIQDDSDLEVTIVSEPSACVNWTGGALPAVSGGTSPYRFSWSTGDTSSFLTNLPVGKAFVLVQDAAGCLQAAQATVGGSKGVNVEADVSGVSCTALDDGAIDLTVVSGFPEYSFFWDDSSVDEDRTGLQFAADYSVEIADSAGCAVSGPITIGDGCDQPLDAVDDYYQAVEGLAQVLPVMENDIAPDRSDIYISIIEDPVQGTSAVTPGLSVAYAASADFNGADSLQYILCNGLEACDSAWVYLSVVEEFVIPNAFSPNGDNENDLFEIRGILEFPDNRLTVFNRWGNEVFSARGYAGEWNGTTANGKNLPEGTYFYSLELGGGEDPRSGYVVIRR